LGLVSIGRRCEFPTKKKSTPQRSTPNKQPSPSDHFQIVSAAPAGHWDHQRHIFLSGSRSSTMHRVLAVHCHHLHRARQGFDGQFPDYRIVHYNSAHEWLLRQDEIVGRSAWWHYLEHECPDIFAVAKTLEFEKDEHSVGPGTSQYHVSLDITLRRIQTTVPGSLRGKHSCLAALSVGDGLESKPRTPSEARERGQISSCSRGSSYIAVEGNWGFPLAHASPSPASPSRPPVDAHHPPCGSSTSTP